MKILTIDIETRPNLAYVWGLWDQNVGLSQLVESVSMVSFAAKWLDEKRVIFYSDHHDDHEAMVRAAWDLMDVADVIVHYNGRSFDIKHMHREFVLLGLDPPSPHRDIDMLTVVKSRFKFPSNKLDYVADQLGLGRKVQTGGMELWIDCMADDPKAWRLMKRYNIGDTKITEKLYLRLLPWIKGHPNHGLYTADHVHVCPSCGGGDLMKRGYAYTPASVYQQYKCKNPACGAWSRGKRRLADTTEARHAA